MKFFLRISVAIVLLSGMMGITAAATGDLRDWMDNLNNEIPFGYTVSQKITVDQININKIIIKSPVIQDEFGNKIKKYTVMFSQYPLSQILENSALLDQSKEKTFDFVTVDSTVTMELTATGDAISPSVVYYLSVIPKDQNGILGEISNELWFKLSNQTSGEGTPATGSLHTAPGANMSLAHITHTITTNRATLSWTSVDGSSQVDIFLWNPTSQAFERLSTVNMGDESYIFTLTRNGEYIIKFVPNNGGTEYRYTFIASGITSSSVTPIAGNPTIGKIPATGPKENVLVVLGIALVAYFVYRKVRAKR
ncbi:MAG: hypothetical protein NTY80_02965 [candidate division SR1 bacterium]|nr:hypothetical protein [candidate division SR1 bacterium]